MAQGGGTVRRTGWQLGTVAGIELLVDYRHYVAQDRPLHVVVGGCALSSEGVCILGFRPDLHRVQGAVATWVKTGENPAAARRAGGKRGGMQGPCGCARGTPF